MSRPSDLLQRVLSKTEGVDKAALAELGRELDFLHGEVTSRPRPALVTVIDVGPLGVAQASIVLDGIPQNYRHLWLVASLRSTQAAVSEAVIHRINNDSGANYDTQSLTAQNAVLTGLESIATANPVIGSCPAASAPANDFGFIEAMYLDYANAGKKKLWQHRTGLRAANASAGVLTTTRTSGYRTAAALTRIDLILLTGTFEIGSRATLYGLT